MYIYLHLKFAWFFLMDFHVGKNIPSIYMDPSCLLGKGYAPTKTATMFQPFQPPNQGTPSPEVPRSSRLWPRGGFLVVRVFGPQNHSGRKKGRIPGSWENLHRTWKWMACCQRKIIWNPPPPWLGVQKPLIFQGVSFLVGGWTNPFETYAQFPQVRDKNEKIFETTT